MKYNNETYGISVEVFLADLFNVELKDNYKSRGSKELVEKLNKTSSKEVKTLFEDKNISIAKFSGEAGGLHDFILTNNKTLSVKSNIGKLGKVCPQKIGQMTSKRFYELYLEKDELPNYEERKLAFKEYVFNNIEKLLKDYYNQLFSSDFIFYISELNNIKPSFFLLSKEREIEFNKDFISFKKDIEEWKSSNQVIYKGSILGEFQLHNNRDCFKFRFFMPTLLSLFSFHSFNIDLFNMDCLEYLKTIPSESIDLVLIDPPYKISRNTGFAGGEKTGRDVDRFRISYQFGNWDNSKDILPKVIKESYRVLKKSGTIICFYDLWKITNLKDWLESNKFKQLRFCEWVKTNPVPINSKKNYLTNSREAIITAVKGGKPTFHSEYDNGIYKYPINHEKGRFHPTQKPLNLIKTLIEKHSNKNETVLDCFSGSGTTAIASLETNRKFTGTELDTNYFEKSIARIKYATEQK